MADWWAQESDPQSRALLSELAAGKLSPTFANEIALQLAGPWQTGATLNQNRNIPPAYRQGIDPYLFSLQASPGWGAGEGSAGETIPAIDKQGRQVITQEPASTGIVLGEGTFGPPFQSIDQSNAVIDRGGVTDQQQREFQALTTEYPYISPKDSFTWLQGLELFAPVFAGPFAAALAPEFAAAGVTAEAASQAAGDAAAAGIIGSNVGAGIGQVAGGQQGAQIGGIAGGLIGGSVSGGAPAEGAAGGGTFGEAGTSLAGGTPAVTGPVTGATAGGLSGTLRSLGFSGAETSRLLGISSPTLQGISTGGASAGEGVLFPAGAGALGGAGIGAGGAPAAPGGGSSPSPGPGSELTTPPTLGGASAGGTTPGTSSLGTGAMPGAGTSMAQPSVSQIATGFNPTTGVINPDAVVASGPSVSDIAAANAAPAVPATTSVGKFLQDPSLGTGVKAAANNVGPLLGAAQIGEVISAGSPAATPQSQSGNTTAGQTPISTIAAAASPSMSAFEPAINDWTRSQELAIRSRFANLGLTGSPMELSSIERSASGAQDRGTMIFDSMSQLGVSDPMIFSSLLNSNFTTADQINQALLSGKIAV